MYLRAIRNDILKSKAITLISVIFVAAAAMLIALAAILIVNLTGAIDHLMARAETPHFMQMHSGELDTVRLTAFAEQNSHVAEFQVLEFLNVDGAGIVFEQGSLANSVQDNGFSVQSEHFDYLLDLDGNIIRPSDSEIYVPISYFQDGTTVPGDRMTVAGVEFTVAGVLRDSQMNSPLASSKRFLVSAGDYANIESSGSTEYLIEFRLKDLVELSEFSTTYTSAGLDANGPTITYPLFRTINALSDGMMIAVILLVSVLVVAIAFLCIRFTLVAKIEDDYREIGVMKAIGLRVSDIRKIYLAKYAALAAVGSVLGFALSFVFKGPLLENIRLNMGESESASLATLFGIIGVLLVFVSTVAYVNGVLRRFRKISPAEAIRFGVSQEKSGGARKFTLSVDRMLSTNVFLGIKDVLSRKKLYVTMLAVLVMAAFIIIVPQNLSNTIASREFISYMGIGESDLLFDIQQTDHIVEKAAQIAAALEGDPSIAKFVVLTTQTFSARLDDGSEVRLKVELGDHSVLPLKYAQGRAPAAENEIALSTLNADELGKQVGDVIPLVIRGEMRDLTVSGIYSDVTNGGKTAKAVFTDDSAGIMWSAIRVQLVDPSLAGAMTDEYARRFPFAKVAGIDEHINQTFGATIRSIGLASWAALAVALAITGLVTLLFMKMLVAKDRYAIAVMKAFGFTDRDITKQYMTRAGFVLVVGILLGTLLANTVGEILAGALIATFGAASFDFVVNPLSAYLLSPLMMVGAVLIATLFGTRDAGRMKIAENIKE